MFKYQKYCNYFVIKVLDREEEAIKLDGMSVAEMKLMRDSSEKHAFQVQTFYSIDLQQPFPGTDILQNQFTTTLSRYRHFTASIYNNPFILNLSINTEDVVFSA